jgi:predicted outer membrane protein
MDRRQFLVGLMGGTAALAVTKTAVAQTAAPAIPAPQYFAMASKGGTFLEESARIGFEKATDPRLRRFARSEVFEQVQLAGDLSANADFATASVPGASAGALGSPTSGALVGAGVGALVGGPIGAVVGLGVGATSSQLAQAAVPGQPVMTSDAQKAATLAQLQSLPPGPQFDALFVQSQIIGHNEALAVHGGYAQAGDDRDLRRVANKAVPMIRMHLSQLSRFQRTIG